MPAEQRDLRELAAQMIDLGIRRVHVLGWRDLEDPDAGGSEAHADEFMRRFAAAGLEVLHRTSAGEGLPSVAGRNGYEVLRRGSRFTVFPRAVASEIVGRMGPYDALVEIWNGVPWLSPLWCRRPRIMFLHHIHGPMWDQILPRPLAAAGRLLETRLAPPLYRRTTTLTPSEATREELLALGFHADRVKAVNNGVDPFFQQGGYRSTEPLVVGVGRLAPVKRFDRLLEAAIQARRRVPNLRLTIVGNGPERTRLEAMISANRAHDWVTLTGHLPRQELRDVYRQAWLMASASLAEGWGLALTEAAACGTPAVATDISGHRCSVVDGTTGVLTDLAHLGERIADVLLDDGWRADMAAVALKRAHTLTWDASALGIITALHGEAVRRQGRRRGVRAALHA